MGRSVILYRGILKSCNYSCSYCPFSKHKSSRRERERDEEQWFRFVEKIEEGFKRGNLQKGFGGVMATPYGEALLHPWYWEGMARLSNLDGMDAVGAQTNLSFSEEAALACFDRKGGMRKKLRLWATFHPEMVSAEEFAQKCIRLRRAGVTLCAGAVGVPEQVKTLRRLRKLLPDDLYFWVNKMDGLGRRYTKEEQRAWEEIDPYFWRELEIVCADVNQCRGRMFVEGNQGLRICNISRRMKTDEYLRGWDGNGRQEKKDAGVMCGRGTCSCYLAYGGRADLVNHVLFGPYPLFRIPRRAKAVFLDIEGTLLPKRSFIGIGKAKIQERELFLETLAKEGALLFFATTLPWEEARRRCRAFSHKFCGGVFAGGAHVVWEDGIEKREHFYELDRRCLSAMEEAREEFGFRVLAYQNSELLYKLTLVRPARNPWDQEEAKRLIGRLAPVLLGKIRWFVEENCLQLVAKEASKANGVRLLCQWTGIDLAETVAVGDSAEDEEMMKTGDCLSGNKYGSIKEVKIRE